ncbi:signal peptidase I [Clostridium porci]|uniref:Signal peptidase I n=1 Tax=Clostridium porci TaxID=2605778 RepID=A0A7X2NKC7_9CLOT|nr:signal peptidase I [Clostridium porci]MSS36499.1 signal peptidase I [Clostridium porci]
MVKALKSCKDVIITILVMIFLMNFVFINAYIPSGSMENTIMTGDRVFGVRFLREFDRGDIVIFKDPDGGDFYLIKRVIGLPGETVTIENGVVSVNGMQLTEAYLKEPMIPEEDFSITLPEEGYFVMGDNRNDSYDARYWEHKIVYEDNIAGKALFRYWPFTQMKGL